MTNSSKKGGKGKKVVKPSSASPAPKTTRNTRLEKPEITFARNLLKDTMSRSTATEKIPPFDETMSAHWVGTIIRERLALNQQQGQTPVNRQEDLQQIEIVINEMLICPSVYAEEIAMNEDLWHVAHGILTRYNDGEALKSGSRFATAIMATEQLWVYQINTALNNLGMGPGTETLWYLIHFEPNTSLFTDLNLTTCGVSFMANIADKIDGSDHSGQNGPLDDTLPGAKIYNDFHLCIQQTCMLTNDTTDCSDPAQCHYLASMRMTSLETSIQNKIVDRATQIACMLSRAEILEITNEPKPVAAWPLILQAADELKLDTDYLRELSHIRIDSGISAAAFGDAQTIEDQPLVNKMRCLQKMYEELLQQTRCRCRPGETGDQGC